MGGFCKHSTDDSCRNNGENKSHENVKKTLCMFAWSLCCCRSIYATVGGALHGAEGAQASAGPGCRSIQLLNNVYHIMHSKITQ